MKVNGLCSCEAVKICLKACSHQKINHKDYSNYISVHTNAR